MKNLFKSGILVLIVAMILYIVYLQTCRRNVYNAPQGYVLVADSTWEKLCNFDPTPLIILTDTFITKGETIYLHDTVPVPVAVNDSINYYPDSVVNDDIHFWQDIWVQGVITKWEKHYEPVIQTVEKEIKIPVPQVVETPVMVPSRGAYLYGTAGGNMGTFVLGAGIDFVTKKQNLYGVQYQRFGDENIYSIKIGRRISLRRGE